MTHSTELRQRLAAGIQELESDIAKLRAAIAALDADGDGTAPARRRQPGRDVTRQYEVVPAGKLASLLSASDGVTTSELAQRTNGRPDQVLALLKELEQAGRAHRSGNRRSTRWHAGAATGAPSPAAPSSDAPADHPGDPQPGEGDARTLDPVAAR